MTAIISQMGTLSNTKLVNLMCVFFGELEVMAGDFLGGQKKGAGGGGNLGL